MKIQLKLLTNHNMKVVNGSSNVPLEITKLPSN